MFFDIEFTNSVELMEKPINKNLKFKIIFYTPQEAQENIFLKKSKDPGWLINYDDSLINYDWEFWYFKKAKEHTSA